MSYATRNQTIWLPLDRCIGRRMTFEELKLMVLLLSPAMMMSVLILITFAAETYD